MSGIAGIFHCGTIKPVDPARVERMADALAHRGPDASGFWTAAGVGLGARRLALIDVAGSRQPLHSADGRAVLVFDGAIDNFRELRRELEGCGLDFRTGGDGEVVLAAWQRWGTACLARLHGAFALAIYDAVARTLLLARDRLGVKPLFTAQLSDGSLAFASELKGLLVHPLLRRELDPLAIEDYLAWGFVPDHRSVLRAVEKLPAGHFRLLRHGTPPAAPQSWWQVSFAERRRASVRDLEAELLHHLRVAVTSRMDAEVPLGAVVSGGVDSASVVALMAEASRGPVRTCSIGSDGPAADDDSPAATVARLFGTDHLARQPTAEPFGAVGLLAAMFDEPFADPSALAAVQLSQLARERMTVALSGAGADAAFAGSRRLVVQRYQDQLRASLPAGFRRSALGAIARVNPLPRARAALQALAGDAAAGYAMGLAVTSPELRDSLYGPDLTRELGGYRAERPLVALFDAAPGRSALDRAQAAELTFRLPGEILTRLDRTGMAAGLEMRTPLLDHRLVEFAASLPERTRVRGGRGKWLLRQAMRRYLPDEIACRTGPVPVPPLAEWLRGPLAGEAQAIAASAPLARTGWFDTGQVQRLVEAHRAGRADHSRLLWQLLMLDRSLVQLGLIS